MTTRRLDVRRGGHDRHVEPQGEPDTAQPPKSAPGVCACSSCGWRAFKFVAMLSGWDARDAGAVVSCRWCRRRFRELGQIDPAQTAITFH